MVMRSGGVVRRPLSFLRNVRYFGGEAKESYAVRGALEQLSDTLTSQVTQVACIPIIPKSPEYRNVEHQRRADC